MNLYQTAYYAIRLNQDTFGIRKGSDFFCGVTGNLVDRSKIVVLSYVELTATISRGRQKAAPCVQNSDREAANFMSSANVIAVIKAARETKTVGDAPETCG